MKKENNNQNTSDKVFTIFMGIAFLAILIYYLSGFIYNLFNAIG